MIEEKDSDYPAIKQAPRPTLRARPVTIAAGVMAMGPKEYWRFETIRERPGAQRSAGWSRTAGASAAPPSRRRMAATIPGELTQLEQAEFFKIPGATTTRFEGDFTISFFTQFSWLQNFALISAMRYRCARVKGHSLILQCYASLSKVGIDGSALHAVFRDPPAWDGGVELVGAARLQPLRWQYIAVTRHNGIATIYPRRQDRRPRNRGNHAAWIAARSSSAASMATPSNPRDRSTRNGRPHRRTGHLPTRAHRRGNRDALAHRELAPARPNRRKDGSRALRSLAAMTAGKLPAILLTCLAVCGPCTGVAAERRPNVILIMADDLGYQDLGCYGHPSIRTPVLDRLAGEGVRLTDFHSGATVCTPSRMALLTGAYPVRLGWTRGVMGYLMGMHDGMSPEALTIAEIFQSDGYATAISGKWHLGDQPDTRPHAQGFQSTYHLSHSNNQVTKVWRGNQVVEEPFDNRKLTEQFTAEAIRFIRSTRTIRSSSTSPTPLPTSPSNLIRNGRANPNTATTATW